MHIISASRRGTVFSPVPSEIAGLIPDIIAVDLEFKQPERIMLLDSHYATQIVWTFRNGQQLTIPGYMFWKFLEAIPPALGSDATGYADNNPYSAEHGSKIMARLRAAYIAMFAPGDSYKPPHPPLRATIDLANGTVATTFPPRLPEDVRKEIVERADRVVAAIWPKTYAELCAWVVDAVRRPRTVLALVDMGNGRWRNQYSVDSWPAPDSVTFDKFLNEYSTERFETHPAHMTYSQCFSRMAEKAAHDIAGNIFRSMQSDAQPMLDRAVAALGLDAEDVNPDYLVHALDHSQDADVVFDLIWSRWFRAMKSQTLADLGAGPEAK